MKVLTNAYFCIKDPLWIWLIHKKFESLMWTTTIHYLFIVAKIQLFQTGLTLQSVKLKRQYGQRFRFSDWINSIVYQEGTWHLSLYRLLRQSSLQRKNTGYLQIYIGLETKNENISSWSSPRVVWRLRREPWAGRLDESDKEKGAQNHEEGATFSHLSNTHPCLCN